VLGVVRVGTLGYGLDIRGIVFGFPVGEKDFPERQERGRDPPASFSTGIGISPAVKWPECVADSSPYLVPRLKLS
jgi:hypothetical protein